MTTTRRQFLSLLGTSAAAAVALAPRRLLGEAAPAAPAAGKMNVLFIAIDDLKPQLNCYGHARMKSPCIDRLAAAGTLFERAYCQQAVCAPTRASLLSGCRPDTTQVFDLQTPLRTKLPDVVTLPQRFKESGYTTISLGKIYHHADKDDPKAWSEPTWRPDKAMWATDEMLEKARRLNAESAAAAPPAEPKAKGKGKKAPASKALRADPVEAGDLPDEAYADGCTAAKAIETLRRVKDKPFFLAVGFLKPHLPFCCPKKYWNMYPPDSINLADNPFKPKGAPAVAMSGWGELRSYYGVPQDGPVPDSQARELIHGYYACVTFTDTQIGKVLDELKSLGLEKNTIVVLWGDHGWHLGDHGLWCKHTNFESATHVPLLLAAPGMKPGQRSRALVEFVDIYPSLCELAGLTPPATVEGTSLVPLLKDPARPWKSAAFSQYPRSGGVMGYSMRTDRYRFTQWIKKPDGEVVAVELYDHEKDPAENTNLAVLPEHAKLVEELTAQAKKGWQGARPA